MRVTEQMMINAVLAIRLSNSFLMLNLPISHHLVKVCVGYKQVILYHTGKGMTITGGLGHYTAQMQVYGKCHDMKDWYYY